jgi:hypothetical protein
MGGAVRVGRGEGDDGGGKSGNRDGKGDGVPSGSGGRFTGMGRTLVSSTPPLRMCLSIQA